MLGLWNEIFKSWHRGLLWAAVIGVVAGVALGVTASAGAATRPTAHTSHFVTMAEWKREARRAARRQCLASQSAPIEFSGRRLVECMWDSNEASGCHRSLNAHQAYCQASFLLLYHEHKAFRVFHATVHMHAGGRNGKIKVETPLIWVSYWMGANG